MYSYLNCLAGHATSFDLRKLQLAALSMERASQITFFLLLIIHSGVAQNATTSGTDEFPVGVILNLESLRGKMARTSILMALEDFYTAHRNYSPKVVLHIRDSKSNSVEAASAGKSSAAYHEKTFFISLLCLQLQICFLNFLLSSKYNLFFLHCLQSRTYITDFHHSS